MDIPEEVIDRAESLYWDRDGSHKGLGCAEEAYEHVAEWARKEALKEAAEAFKLRFIVDYSIAGRLVGHIGPRDVAEAHAMVRALTEGDNTNE